MQQRGPEMVSVGEMDLQSRRIQSRWRVFLFGTFGDKSEIGHQLAAAPEVAGDGDVLEVGALLGKGRLRMFEQGGGAMQMQSAFAALCDREVLQDLGLKRRAKTFGLSDSIVP